VSSESKKAISPFVFNAMQALAPGAGIALARDIVEGRADVVGLFETGDTITCTNGCKILIL
jgi:hypothetical protein